MNKVTLGLTRAAFRTLNVVSPFAAAKLAQRLYTFPPRRVRPWPAEDREFFDKAQTFEIPYPRQPLRGWSWGPKDAQGILLVHGWGDGPNVFTDLARQLVDAGLRVHTYEAPAHGTRPERRSDTMKWADSVLATTDVLGPLHGIVAHSVGAGAVVIAAKKNIDVQRVALVSPLTCIIRHTDGFADSIGCSRRSIAMMRHYAWTYSEPSSSNYARYWEDLFISPEIEPALIIHDVDDRVIPVEHSERLATLWPNARLVTTKGLGHRRITRDPGVLGEVTKFITEAAGIYRARIPMRGTR